MLNKNLFTYALLLFSQLTINAQIDTTLKNYFPTQVGNYWEYRDVYNTGDIIFRMEVVGDTVMPNGYLYNIFDRYSFSSTVPDTFYFRVDDSMRVMRGGGIGGPCNGETIEYHLNLPDSTYWKDCAVRSQDLGEIKVYPIYYNTFKKFYPHLMIERDTKAFCGIAIDTVRNITHECGWGDYSILEHLAYGIGIIEVLGGYGGILTYAKIDGKEYGYTVSVDERSRLLPSNVILFQNYPNPFNPSTVISWQLKDVLGKEIKTLVNQYYPAGIYSRDFNAGDLPSGVYFYKLTADKLSITKKMLLLS